MGFVSGVEFDGWMGRGQLGESGWDGDGGIQGRGRAMGRGEGSVGGIASAWRKVVRGMLTVGDPRSRTCKVLISTQSGRAGCQGAESGSSP